MPNLNNILRRLDNAKRISERTGIGEKTVNKVMLGEKEPTKREYALIKSYLKQVNSYITRFVKKSK